MRSVRGLSGPPPGLVKGLLVLHGAEGTLEAGGSADRGVECADHCRGNHLHVPVINVGTFDGEYRYTTGGVSDTTVIAVHVPVPFAAAVDHSVVTAVARVVTCRQRQQRALVGWHRLHAVILIVIRPSTSPSNRGGSCRPS